MYTVSVVYSNKTHKFDEFQHIIKISFESGDKSMSIDEKDFESFNFPHNKSLNLHSQTTNHLINPKNIIYIKFEKESDQ